MEPLFRNRIVERRLVSAGELQRSPATPRYVLLGGVWLTILVMLLWGYGGS